MPTNGSVTKRALPCDGAQDEGAHLIRATMLPFPDAGSIASRGILDWPAKPNRPNTSCIHMNSTEIVTRIPFIPSGEERT